jgi:hypothetical protein
VGGAAPRDRSISQQLQVAGIASIGVLSGARVAALERPAPKAETTRFAHQVAHRTTAMEWGSVLGPSENPSISLPPADRIGQADCRHEENGRRSLSGSLAIERPASAEISPIKSKRANAGNRHGGKTLTAGAREVDVPSATITNDAATSPPHQW